MFDVDLDVDKDIEHLDQRLACWDQAAVPVVDQEIRPQGTRLSTTSAGRGAGADGVSAGRCWLRAAGISVHFDDTAMVGNEPSNRRRSTRHM